MSQLALATQPLVATIDPSENDRRPIPLYQPKLGSHLPALDAVRGLAILMATVYRFGSFGPDDPTSIGRAFTRILTYGSHGVDLFFVLSGFLITGILFDAKGTDHYFRNFYMRRTLRIFPLYYGVLFIAFIALPLFGVGLGWFNHFWSLAVEEQFYLFWPLVIFLCNRRRAMAVCFGCIVLATGIRIGLALMGNQAVAIEALTPCRLDALAAGALLALAARGPLGVRGLVPVARISMLVSGAGLVAVVLWLGRRWRIDQDGDLAIKFTLFTWLFAGLIVLVLAAPPDTIVGRFWNLSLLRFFGKYSYGWYVFQNLLIPFTLAHFSAETLAASAGSVFIGRVLYIAIMGVATLLIAIVSWNMYEKHFLRLKAAFSGGSRTSGLTAHSAKSAC